VVVDARVEEVVEDIRCTAALEGVAEMDLAARPADRVEPNGYNETLTETASQIASV
jgi:hypothetical protein